MPKEKVKTSKLRKPFYELSDSAYAFKTATIGTDEKLKDMAKKIVELQDKIYKHLVSNYIWD